MNAQERIVRRAELRRVYRQRKIDELLELGEGELALEVQADRCGCGCGAPLSSMTVRTFYVDKRHSQRAYRRRLERAAEASGVPARLSLQALQASNPSRERRDDAPAPRTARERRPLPGVRIYFPTVELVERLEQALDILDVGGWGETYRTRELREAIAPPLERRRARDELDEAA